MKGLIFYFSGTGTTKLAIEYIASKINNIEFDFHDMYDKTIPNMDQYKILGFATYTDCFAPPKYAQDFIKNLHSEEKIYAFIFNTYGFINGNTLNILGNLVKNQGYKLIAGYSLHTPESSPIMINNKITSSNAPNKKEFLEFNNFIKKLEKSIKRIQKNELIESFPIKEKTIFKILKNMTKKPNLISIGNKNVNLEKCTKCKLCQEKCPYGAIYFENEFPKFDENKCESCFICYNKCPVEAISSNKYNSGRYRNPNDKITKKLSINQNKETIKN